MASITRNQYGGITINNRVLVKMVIEEILKYKDNILLCNKKGKLIKNRPTPFIDPDYYDALELSEKKNHINLKIYAVSVDGHNISDISECIFDGIENIFEMVGLNKPDNIVIKLKGIKKKDIVEREKIDITRRNV